MRAPMKTTLPRLAVFMLAFVWWISAVAQAAERVGFVVGPNAPALEKRAAEESAAQFQRLFSVETVVAAEASPDANSVVLIGSPETNPAVKDALGDNWPKVSDQGIVIKSIERNGKPALILGGGSPAATFWAVCEFGYRNGIRYLLHEDIYPAAAVPLKLDGHDVVMEPALKTRAWRAIGESALSPVSWGLADQQRLFKQLAKMKFNRVMLPLALSQPFISYEWLNEKNQPGSFFPEVRVDGDTPGKVAFQGAKVFENPDFAAKKSREEKIAAGKVYIEGLIGAAQELGMSAELSVATFELPQEFRQPRFAVVDLQNDEWRATFARQVVADYLTEYPSADDVCWYSIPRENSPEPIPKVALEKSLSGDTVKLTAVIVVGLSQDQKEWKPNKYGKRIELSIGMFSTMMPVNLVSDDAKLGRFDVSLASPAAGILPQSLHSQIQEVVATLAQQTVNGFATRYFTPGDLDPTLHYLSRASWDPKITAREAHDQLFTATTGKQSVADRLWQAFDAMEKATALIDQNDAGFAYPSPDMLTKHMKAEPAPSWWKDVTNHYVTASGEFYRAHDAADPRSRKLLFYFAKRSEYVLEYLAAVEAARASAIAKMRGDADEAAAQLDTAVEQLYNALDTLSDVARDQSDRGLIAMLAEYAYRPLAAEVERLANGEPAPAEKKE